mgnify:CR=1 FL=1
MRFYLLPLVVVLATFARQLPAQERLPVMMADMRRDTTDTLFSAAKVEAGLALALELSGRFRFIPSAVRDSIARTVLTERGQQLTLKDITTLSGGKAALFASCFRMGNLLRAEVNMVVGDELNEQRYGIGYDIIRLRTDAGKPLPDPAILRAMQRALCKGWSNDTLFANAPDGFRTRPTELVAVGGITFVDSTSLPPWNLFKDKITVSYDMVQTIVHECINDSMRTVVDIESRDAMYAAGGMYMTENYNPITDTELATLAKYEVGFYITGSLVRNDKGALLNLQYSQLGPNMIMVPLLKSSVPVTTDSKTAIRDAVRVAVRQLFR